MVKIPFFQCHTRHCINFALIGMSGEAQALSRNTDLLVNSICNSAQEDCPSTTLIWALAKFSDSFRVIGISKEEILSSLPGEFRKLALELFKYMTIATKPKSGYEKWQASINKAVGDAKWNAYDCEIQTAVGEINRHLSGTVGYRQLDWQLIKAMTWVETGATNIKWKSSPIQIGNPGDPGLNALLSGKEGGDLILPSAWKTHLNRSNVIAIPAYSIRAGIGYLLMKMAHFSIKSVPDADLKIYKVTVKANDSLDKIAKVHGSTVEVMKTLNPKAHVLHPGQVVAYQKAAVKKVVVGWKPITTLSIAMYYNGGGDPLYAKKLAYSMAAIRKGMSAVCH